jgi:hypothetical protein
MAKPIPLELPKRDSQEELRSRLEKAPDEHAEALLEAVLRYCKPSMTKESSH